MDDQAIAGILRQLVSREKEQAWSEFLEAYSPYILQVVHFLERDEDQRADSFLYVCEQLSQNRFQRLRRFRVGGPASFTTWLRVVVRNLCLDRRRKMHGRPRIPASLRDLPLVDQEVFRCVFHQHMKFSETALALQPLFPAIDDNRVGEIVERLGRRLSTRQRWILRVRAATANPVGRDQTDDGQGAEQRIADPAPGPEHLADLAERRAVLARAMSRLSGAERLLLRLRFEQGLTLEQVARLTGLENAQRVDRRIKELLRRLREEMS
jgi:RNA polymerase sigma factor (sigma-70 family)